MQPKMRLWDGEGDEIEWFEDSVEAIAEGLDGRSTSLASASKIGC